jgi:hypothetical protein
MKSTALSSLWFLRWHSWKHKVHHEKPKSQINNTGQRIQKFLPLLWIWIWISVRGVLSWYMKFCLLLYEHNKLNEKIVIRFSLILIWEGSQISSLIYLVYLDWFAYKICLHFRSIVSHSNWVKINQLLLLTLLVRSKALPPHHKNLVLCQ